MKYKHSTLKNLNKRKILPIYKIPKKFKLFNFKNSGGLRKKGYNKNSIAGKPLITIITVSLNSENTIQKTILSVLNQTYDNIEYIIIDGKSSDNTVKIIKHYENSIDLWISERDKGIFNAINKGIRVSTGDIIGILNSDDTLTKNALKLVKNYFKDDVDFLFGTVKKDRLLSGFNKKKIKWKFNVYPAHSSGFFISRKAQLKVGFYDERFKLHADYDLIYKLTSKLKLNGIAMKKADVTGIFNIKGRTDRESKMNYFYEEFMIRKSNQQNVFFIITILFLRVIHYLFFRIKIFTTISKLIQRKIDF
jgi:glycosyltransferase involved in cell wall biosynthesis